MGAWASQQAKAGVSPRGHVIAGTRGSRPPREAPRTHFVEVRELRNGGQVLGVFRVSLDRSRSRAAIIAAGCDELRATTKDRRLMTASLTGRVIAPEVA